MGNRRLYKIECLHVLGMPESERLKVTALPSPERLHAAQGFGRRGFAQAGLFHPTASLPFQKVGFFILRHNLSGERGRVRGANLQEFNAFVLPCFLVEKIPSA
jgi:hypothetical protein